MPPKKTNRRIRWARISSGGLRSSSSLFASGPAFAERRRGKSRDGCFGTRDVYNAVTPYATRPRVHAYLATICRDLGAEFVRVGGVADHVHVVTTLPRTVSQAELIEQIKKASSKWIRTLDARYRGSSWQRAFGAFSVSTIQF